MKAPNRAIGLRTAAAASGAAYWQMLTTANVLQQEIRKITAILNTAVQTELLLIRAASNGTQTSPVNANNLNPSISSTYTPATFATAWSVAPTIGAATTAIARATLPAVIGSNVEWTFEEGSLILSSLYTSLLLWNVGSGAGGVLDVNVEFYGY